MKRIGLSYVDADPRKAEQDRDVVSSVQDLQGVEISVITPAANTEF
jgi:hypothetical protein